MFVKIMIALTIFIGCLANAFEEIPYTISKQINSSHITFDLIGNCHVRNNKLPILEKFLKKETTQQYTYNYFPPSFIATFSMKKNGNMVDIFRYSIFNTYTCRHCDDDGGIILNVSQEPIEESANLYYAKITSVTKCAAKALFQTAAIYTSCVQLLDIIGFHFFVHIDALTLSFLGGGCLGYSKQGYDLNVKDIENSYDLLSSVGEREYRVPCKYLPAGNEFAVSYYDSVAFIGFPLVVKGIFEIEPFVMEYSARISPYIGVIANVCNIVGKFPSDYIAPDIEYEDFIPGSYSCGTDSWMLTYPGATLELICKCLWNIASENYNIQFGVGYEWFSLYYIYFTWTCSKDTILETISRIYGMRDSVIYSGYVLSLGLEF